MAATGQHSPAQPATAVQAITVIMGSVVGLTFLFGFGNVLNLALRLGVPVWVAPLVAPAVDLSIFGLLLGTRHLALTGAPVVALRPARRLLVFASAVTLALNVADPLVAGEYGKAAFDAVGPLLLIGWAEVGPGLLQAISATHRPETATTADCVEHQNVEVDEPVRASARSENRTSGGHPPAGLLQQARYEDTAHRAAHQKPISADALRVRLGIGATPARQLVKIVRAEFQANVAPETLGKEPTCGP
jgi:hypothetical protein